MSRITVYKLDENGREVLSYDGDVVERGATWVYLRAVFQVERADLGMVTFWRGDVFHEWFYTDRWYNVFRVHDGETGALRGWYCNVTRPAEITAGAVRSDDLALDVFIAPNGDEHLLDADEFDALPLDADERRQARAAVEQIRRAYATGSPPFYTGG